MVSRWRWLAYHLGNGIYYGFPLCCVLRFCLHGWRWGNDSPQATHRGVTTLPIPQRPPGDNDGRFVPCGIFHPECSTCRRRWWQRASR